MRVEMANIRRGRGGGGVGEEEEEEEESIMFTRLDSKRNAKALQRALEKNCISPAVYQRVTASMDEYLQITSMRLACLGRRVVQKAASSSLVYRAKKTSPDAKQAAGVEQDVSEVERRRQMKFAAVMKGLGARRIDIARSLTHTLSHIEKKAGVFLVKPVYASRRMRSCPLVMPIPRPLPLRAPPPPPSRPHTSAGFDAGGARSGRSTPHPTMRLVSGLVRSRRSRRGEKGEK